MAMAELLRSALMRFSRTFIWSATALGLAILLIFFAVMAYDSYRSTLQINEQAASNIATLAEQDVDRNIELLDLSLRAVLEGVNDAEVMRQTPRLRQITLFDRSATARGLGALVALDRHGTIFLDSLSEVPRAGNFGDREYFLAHANTESDIGLYVSQPFRARLQGNIWSMSVSRRITQPDGNFGGIVSGTVKLDYFQRLFNKVALGSGGLITLFRSDGILLARSGDNDNGVGTSRHTPVFARFSGATHGSFISDQTDDRVPRLFAFTHVGQLPLIVVVALPLRQVLAPWWSKTLVFSAIFMVMVGSVLLLVWMLDHELRRRATAETAAATLARTDGLTRLANRRAFEEGLAREWARAARHGRSMALIMIDVDHFKLFNDTYGHQAGDNALTAIAGVIAHAVKRPGDLAARYGGEEFAILLPDTDRRGALVIAAAIREGVSSLGMDHAASSHRVVTVSAGVAMIVARAGAKAAFLVRDADAELYRAKARGRNAVSSREGDVAELTPLLSRAS